MVSTRNLLFQWLIFRWTMFKLQGCMYTIRNIYKHIYIYMDLSGSRLLISRPPAFQSLQRPCRIRGPTRPISMDAPHLKGIMDSQQGTSLHVFQPVFFRGGGWVFPWDPEAETPKKILEATSWGSSLRIERMGEFWKKIKSSQGQISVYSK